MMPYEIPFPLSFTNKSVLVYVFCTISSRQACYNNVDGYWLYYYGHRRDTGVDDAT